jgi:hypothetical protein
MDLMNMKTSSSTPANENPSHRTNATKIITRRMKFFTRGRFDTPLFIGATLDTPFIFFLIDYYYLYTVIIFLVEWGGREMNKKK